MKKKGATWIAMSDLETLIRMIRHYGGKTGEWHKTGDIVTGELHKIMFF